MNSLLEGALANPSQQSTDRTDTFRIVPLHTLVQAQYNLYNGERFFFTDPIKSRNI